jgi:hypothetical protein
MTQVVRETKGSVKIEQQFDEAGVLIQELFKSGGDVMLFRQRADDGGFEESYFVKSKLVSRDRYERARKEIPDMPAATPELDKWSDTLRELQGDLRREKRERKSRQNSIVADPVAADQKDVYCKNVLATERCISLDEFLGIRGAVLGTMSGRTSRAAASRFKIIGAADITIWGVSHSTGEPTSCEGLIVGLPQDARTRAALFKQAGKIASAGGFDPDTDVGQSLLFVRFE